ncbi:hypothetical protein MTR67_022524 [Solanum verrucosum]|uniref:Uncharacterized protein n=1 Tax=Solanum verrucosum TaxID=315347 RepID=A0AAF0TRD3_SOLVR|nr:hypothetical protein MTR67_022524 [Solanum verrucosum]
MPLEATLLKRKTIISHKYFGKL